MQPIKVRDNRKPGWLWADRAIIIRDGPQLGPYAIAIYIALCAYANEEQTAWPSISTIAHNVGCSKSQAKYALKKLEQAGWIHIERRRDGNRNLTNIYHLLPTPSPIPAGGSSHDPGVGHHMTQGGSPHDPGWVTTWPRVGHQVTPNDTNRTIAIEREPEEEEENESAPPHPPPPAQIYFQFFDHPLTKHQLKKLENIKDLERWERVLEAWAGQGYSPRNTTGMLDWYHNGIPAYAKPNGRRPVPKPFAGIAAVADEESIDLGHFMKETAESQTTHTP